MKNGKSRRSVGRSTEFPPPNPPLQLPASGQFSPALTGKDYYVNPPSSKKPGSGRCDRCLLFYAGKILGRRAEPVSRGWRSSRNGSPVLSNPEISPGLRPNADTRQRRSQYLGAER